MNRLFDVFNTRGRRAWFAAANAEEAADLARLMRHVHDQPTKINDVTDQLIGVGDLRSLLERGDCGMACFALTTPRRWAVTLPQEGRYGRDS